MNIKEALKPFEKDDYYDTCSYPVKQVDPLKEILMKKEYIASVSVTDNKRRGFSIDITIYKDLINKESLSELVKILTDFKATNFDFSFTRSDYDG
jgi:hypothetical protein